LAIGGFQLSTEHFMSLQILIADDDPVAQKVLRTVLQQAGYQVQSTNDGASALGILLKDDAPPIAIVDWMMPGLNGPELCTKIRESKLQFRPYIIMLSGKADKIEIAAALDAGADDYLSKPFNRVEFLARLRVAGRTVQAQAELQKYIAYLKSLAVTEPAAGSVRNSPAPLPAVVLGSGEMVKGAASTSTDTVQKAVGNTPSEPAAAGAQAAPIDFEKLVLDTVSPYEFGAVEIAQPNSADFSFNSPGFTAWSGFAIPSRELWVDSLLTVDDVRTDAWHQFSLHRQPVNRNEALRFVAEKHALLTESLKITLAEDNIPTSSPLKNQCSHYMRSRPTLPVPAGAYCKIFRFADLSAYFQVWVGPCLIKWKRPAQLSPGNVVAEVFPPAQVSSLPFLNLGVTLNERYIEKILELGATEYKDLKISVFQPSSLATWFDQQRQRSENGAGI
jgi:DNA-binding response OmpR family regulator